MATSTQELVDIILKLKDQVTAVGAASARQTSAINELRVTIAANEQMRVVLQGELDQAIAMLGVAHEASVELQNVIDDLAAE